MLTTVIAAANSGDGGNPVIGFLILGALIWAVCHCCNKACGPRSYEINGTSRTTISRK